MPCLYSIKTRPIYYWVSIWGRCACARDLDPLLYTFDTGDCALVMIAWHKLQDINECVCECCVSVVVICVVFMRSPLFLENSRQPVRWSWGNENHWVNARLAVSGSTPASFSLVSAASSWSSSCFWSTVLIPSVRSMLLHDQLQIIHDGYYDLFIISG